MDITISNSKVGTIKLTGLKLEELKEALNIIGKSEYLPNKLFENQEEFEKHCLSPSIQSKNIMKDGTMLLNNNSENAKSLPRFYDEDGNAKEYQETYNRIICPECKQGGAIIAVNDYMLIYDYSDNTLNKIPATEVDLKGKDNKISKDKYLETIVDLHYLEGVEKTVFTSDNDNTVFMCPCCDNRFLGKDVIEEVKKYDYSFCPICNEGELDPVMSTTSLSMKCTTEDCLDSKENTDEL